MIIDTHAHLNHPLFKKDRKKVIERCLDNDLRVINVGTNLESSQEVINLSKKEGLFAAVGLHPMNLKTGVLRKKYLERNKEKMEEDFNYNKYKKLAKYEGVVAIGEIGLDYYWKPKTTRKKKIYKDGQKELLLKQLKLAKKLDLPVIFHCRMANNDLIKLLKENPDLRPDKAVMHCFVGNLEELKEYLNFGFHIGFNGIIFKTLEGIDFKEIIKNTPLSRMLIETDCPFLSPPESEEKRNEPIFVKYVLKELSKVKEVDLDKLTTQTTQNAKKLFNI